MILAIFWGLIGVFGLIVSILVIPAVGELVKGPQFLVPFAIFFLLGGILVFLTLKKKVKGKQKKFLLLTGSSAVGFFVSIVLHNLFYAAAILTSEITALRYLFEFLHTLFFFLAIPLCPLGFLIGAAGNTLMLVRKKRRG